MAINFQPSYIQSRRRIGENLTIHREIFEIIDSDIFWANLMTIAEILYPYCKMLNILQYDNARLVQVIHGLAYLVQFWNNHKNQHLAERILTRLNKRWNNWEQPLLILACLLHPKYRMTYFKDKSVINYSKLGKYLIYYYRTWSGKKPTCILREFSDFSKSIYPFDDNTYNQFDDIWKYWNYVEASTNELGLVACRLYGICINAAAVERLWSCMGFLQTNRRNRLMVNLFFNTFY